MVYCSTLCFMSTNKPQSNTTGSYSSVYLPIIQTTTYYNCISTDHTNHKVLQLVATALYIYRSYKPQSIATGSYSPVYLPIIQTTTYYNW